MTKQGEKAPSAQEVDDPCAPVDQETRAEILEEARIEMEREVIREIVDIFGEILDRMWERLAAMLGEPATAAIFDAARRESSAMYTFLNQVRVDTDGVHVNCLEENLIDHDRGTIRGGLMAFLDSILALLTDLTGDLLVGKVQPLVHEFRQQVEED